MILKVRRKKIQKFYWWYYIVEGGICKKWIFTCLSIFIFAGSKYYVAGNKFIKPHNRLQHLWQSICDKAYSCSASQEWQKLFAPQSWLWIAPFLNASNNINYKLMPILTRLWWGSISNYLCQQLMSWWERTKRLKILMIFLRQWIKINEKSASDSNL